MGAKTAGQTTMTAPPRFLLARTLVTGSEGHLRPGVDVRHASMLEHDAPRPSHPRRHARGRTPIPARALREPGLSGPQHRIDDARMAAKPIDM